MGLFDGIKKRENENIDGFNDYTDGDTMWIPNNDEIPEYVEEEPVNTQNSFGGINEAAVSLKLVTPKSLADTAKIADYLIAGSSVVLNIEEISAEDFVLCTSISRYSPSLVIPTPSGAANDII